MSQLPNRWIDVALGDVIQFKYGKSLPDRNRSGKSFPVFGSNGIVGLHHEFLARDECLVVGRKGSVGEIHFSKKPCWPIDTTYFVDEFHGMPARYWYHMLRWLELDKLNRATAIPGLNRNDAYAQIVPIAPLPEQKRIADKLDRLLARVDACRERLDRVPALLKRFRQSVLAAATSGELTREWREENGMAEEWEETSIEEIAFVGTGSTPLRSNSAFFAEDGVPWITSAMTGMPFVDRAQEFVTKSAISAHRLKIYPAGTLLMALYGEGKTRGQVTELRIEATINQACAAICVNETKARKQFVRLVLESNYLQMRQLAEGGSQPNLNLSKVKGFRLLLPTLREQDQVIQRAGELFEILAALESRLNTVAEFAYRLTPATLAKAFRGELVPQDPTDEPAAALLARIAAARDDAGAPARRGRRKAPTGD